MYQIICACFPVGTSGSVRLINGINMSHIARKLTRMQCHGTGGMNVSY